MVWLSSLELILSNFFVIYLATTQNWNTQQLLLTYWIQSVIIGIFQFLKILNLEQFTANNFDFTQYPAGLKVGTKYFMGFFFLVHYGLFHLIYLIFILTFGAFGNIESVSPFNFQEFFLVSIIFLINHSVSFFLNRSVDRTQNKNIGKLMSEPYARIIPMHLTLIFGYMLGMPRMFFLSIKALTDLYAHLREHGLIKRQLTTVSNI